MSQAYTPARELSARTRKLQELMSQNDLDGALIVQKADLFYFSGTAQNAYLFIPTQGEPFLMVKKSFKRAGEESALKNVAPLKGLEEVAGSVSTQVKEKGRLGLEFDVLPASQYLKFKSIFPQLELVDVSKYIREIRMIKSPYEIDRMKEAADLNFAMFSEVDRILREGMTEVELAGGLEAVYRRKGHQGGVRVRGFNQELFYGHVLSGWNSAYPSFFDGPTGGTGLNPSYPQGAGFKKIGRNEPIVVDYVGVYNGYMVDQTRIFAIGTLSEKLMKAHETALKIKARIVQDALPGANGKDLYEAACAIARDAGLEEYFMGFEDRPSFIGHGVGIELDDLPVIARNFNLKLKAGMVFALEPKFIFPGEGAVGVEDTFVVTERGVEQITRFDDAVQTV
ncbi:MAG: Xaa-Pro peptidase family protein [Firmicutes bacterium]|nr:Xaa-Pro peptidase family protein [Bacillota bacterium]